MSRRRLVSFVVVLVTALVANACGSTTNPTAPTSAAPKTQEVFLRSISDTFIPGVWQGYGIRNADLGKGVLKVEIDSSPSGGGVDLSIMEERQFGTGNCDQIVFSSSGNPQCLVIVTRSPDPMANPKVLDVAVDNLETFKWVSLRPTTTSRVNGTIKFVGELRR